ncbi:MAG TPA: hypothetical protein VMW48_16090, partial [Vicinamibacterales bacterium]|nr:hypothetical protein [Vicinamibacterales bacterium]
MSLSACGSGDGAPMPAPPERVDPAVAAIATQSARFASTDLSADVAALPESERRALAHLVRAAQVMDALFLRQVWAGNEALLTALVNDDTPLGRARLGYFLVNKGPWSRLDHNEPFVPAVPAKPAAANFYPADATKEEVEKWLGTLAGPARQAATGFFTTIRRGGNGRLMAVPYNVEYQGELAVAAGHLREAAAATTQPTLKAYLEARAAAFLSNDYYDSDVKWMELDASIEPTIGPYE